LNTGASGADLIVVVFFALSVNGLFALIPANIASKKGYSKLGFWLIGFFISFIISLIIALVLNARETSLQKTQEAASALAAGQLPRELKCPYCAELISTEAKICKHCRSDVEQHFSKMRMDLATEISQRRNQQLLDEARKTREANLESERKNAEKAKISNRRKQKRDAFIQSRTGRITLIGSGLLVITLLTSYIVQVSGDMAKENEKWALLQTQVSQILEECHTTAEFYRQNDELTVALRDANNTQRQGWDCFSILATGSYEWNGVFAFDLKWDSRAKLNLAESKFPLAVRLYEAKSECGDWPNDSKDVAIGEIEPSDTPDGVMVKIWLGKGKDELADCVAEAVLGKSLYLKLKKKPGAVFSREDGFPYRENSYDPDWAWFFWDFQ
jgi:hypothetical protein